MGRRRKREEKKRREEEKKNKEKGRREEEENLGLEILFGMHVWNISFVWKNPIRNVVGWYKMSLWFILSFG